MSGVSLTSTTDVLPFSSNDQTVKLIKLKLASAEFEASKLSSLLADDDLVMNLSGDGALEVDNTKWKLNVISPILTEVSEVDTSQEGDLVSRVCRLEGVMSSFRSTIARVTRERDHWRQEKLSSDERFTHATDAFKTEITRLHRDAETECIRAAEAKEKAENIAEQLRSDLLQTVNSLVSVSWVSVMLLWLMLLSVKEVRLCFCLGLLAR